MGVVFMDDKIKNKYLNDEDLKKVRKYCEEFANLAVY